MKLKDKVILITASTRGIGLACVKACAEEGAAVYMAARNPGLAKKESEKLNSQGCNVKCVYNDAGKPETYITMTDDVVKDAGRIDVLINNFGTSDPGKDLDFSNTDTDTFLDTVNINLRSVFMASQQAVKYMAEQGGGSIINISSSRDRMSQPQTESYTAAKGGIAALTHGLAMSLAGKVRVNSISPGWIDTDYTIYEGPDAVQQPVGRVGNPLDIANMVLFLSSDKAGFITGENICIDGGMTKQMIYHNDFGWNLEG